MVEEALRIADRAKREGLALRLLGGIAIGLRAKDGLPPVFRREYNDSDWITPKGTSADAQRLFEVLGYSPQVRFNAIYGRERLLFFDERHGRRVDVFVGAFRMSQKIPFGKRLDVEPVTIPLAERELQERIEQDPKSLAWKMRSKIGERKRWYDLPEEVG